MYLKVRFRAIQEAAAIANRKQGNSFVTYAIFPWITKNGCLDASYRVEPEGLWFYASYGVRVNSDHLEPIPELIHYPKDFFEPHYLPITHDSGRFRRAIAASLNVVG